MSDAAPKSPNIASKTKAKNSNRNKNTSVDIQQRNWKAILYFFILLTLLSLAYLVYALMQVNDYNSGINKLETNAIKIVRNVNDATFSNNPDISASAYSKLENSKRNYDQALQRLLQHPAGNATSLQDLASEWRPSREQIDFILSNSESVHRIQDQYEQEIKGAVTQIQQAYNTATEQAIVNQLSVSQVSTIEEQIIRAERMKSAFKALTSSTEGSPEDFIELANLFEADLTLQRESIVEQVPAINDVDAIYNESIAPLVQEMSQSGSDIALAAESRSKALNLISLSNNTYDKLQDIKTNLFTRMDVLLSFVGLLAGILGTILSFSRLVKLRNLSAQRLLEKETLRQRQDIEHESERARKIQEENERNQMAILRLLDELGDLAEGDLTVNATVSEDFTGAIADSVNFAIDQLRQLVLAINTTAVRVAQSSEQTQMTAMELAEASENQAQEIAGVSAAINEMVVSIDQVSMNAAESASVAERSVAIAHNGAEVVQRSIEGMNTIRDQIQETSKRIKRLGESSQEIGEIIGLINDIADQTNVLALNAAIQASMAGEAGRGFAVVADEVQRLAERSANATKQIETLVKTIQADTNEAVMSMESTTTEVVRGARLAIDAGEALEEVQTVSNNLAGLIQNISNAAQQQASSAGHISKTMNIIQDITSQTSSGTMATARSVGQLNEMASALQESVSDFKLDDGDDMLLQDI